MAITYVIVAIAVIVLVAWLSRRASARRIARYQDSDADAMHRSELARTEGWSRQYRNFNGGGGT